MLLSNDPASIVQQQLDAYNAKDVDALLALYAEDAQMFEHPDKLLASGVAEFRERFTARFQEPNLRAVLLNRTVMGKTVIDLEEIHRTFPDGTGRIRVLMIYEVQYGLIAKAWTIVGEKMMD